MQEIDIWNMALAHVGNQSTVASTTENSAEKIACTRFFKTARDLSLREYQFSFSRKFEALQLIEEDPTSEWGYSYKYPNDCLFLRRIFSGIRHDYKDSRVPYLVGQGSNSLLIYTDMEDAELEFTSKCDLVGLWPVDFCMGVSLRLASLIAPSITGGDPTKLGIRALELYNIHMSRAVATSINEQQLDPDPDDSFTRSRSG